MTIVEKIGLLIPFIFIAIIEIFRFSGEKDGFFDWGWFLIGLGMYSSACFILCRIIWKLY